MVQRIAFVVFNTFEQCYRCKTKPRVAIRHLMNCKHCQESCIRKGMSNGIQKYRCRSCGKYQRRSYLKNAYTISDQQLILLTKEGCGIRSIARITAISPSTVIRRVLRIGRKLKRPFVLTYGKNYQMDELFTYIGNKKNRICVAYAIDAETGKAIDLVVGRRTKASLSKVISTLLLSNPQKIITDKLPLYKELIPHEIHSLKFRGINKLERLNLTLRTHLKRLNRRTICYSKSIAVLTAIVKIYFWPSIQIIK